MSLGPLLHEELRSARESALAFSDSAGAGHDFANDWRRRILRITGDDRVTWLNGMVTCDVAKLREGGLQYGLAVTQKGRILADFQLICEKDALLVALPFAVAEDVRAAFEKYVIMEDCELAFMDDVVSWSIVGPKTPAAIEALRAAGAHTGVATSSGYAIANRDTADRVEAAMREAGIAEGGNEAREILRQENGAPKFGADFDDKLYPQEAALEKRAVSFDKGCYLGQEVVCMLEMRGHVKRKLVSLAVEGSDAIEKGAPVTTTQGEKIGEVTSSAKTPALGVLAIAMVKASHMAAKTELRVGDAKAVVRDTI